MSFLNLRFENDVKMYGTQAALAFIYLFSLFENSRRDIRMIKRTLENFDISQICESGQCFRMMQRNGNVYSVIAAGRYLEVEQEGSECVFSCGEEEFDNFWRGYFDLEKDYSFYISQIDPRDGYLKGAAQFGSGIRILRQELWEVIASFLISQQNNIVRIRRCINNICERYGEPKVNFRGEEYFAFPEPEALAHLPEDALKECNLGYRSKYVVRTAASIATGETNLENICRVPYEKAKEELLKLFGVGEKVADCICLMGLHHTQAFPVDTHIRQALDKHYKRGFPKRRYKGYEGILQQYIFYWELKNGGRAADAAKQAGKKGA